jgi:hypothetical protein
MVIVETFIDIRTYSQVARANIDKPLFTMAINEFNDQPCLMCYLPFDFRNTKIQIYKTLA